MCSRCGVKRVWARGMCNTCYSAHRRRMLAYGRWEPEVLVSGVGSTRRLRALVAMGWRISDLSDELGFGHPRSTVADLVAGREVVKASTAARVSEVYVRLRAVPGTSRLAAQRARAKGWATPTAWDAAGIDDESAVPVRGCGPGVSAGTRMSTSEVSTRRLQEVS